MANSFSFQKIMSTDNLIMPGELHRLYYIVVIISSKSLNEKTMSIKDPGATQAKKFLIYQHIVDGALFHYCIITWGDMQLTIVCDDDHLLRSF